jgi:hypothetical protein
VLNPIQSQITASIAAALDAGLAELRVGMPGIIQSFDETTQTADVQPCLSDVVIVDGVRQEYQLPVIPSVQVIFYGTNRMVMTIPPAAGDECWLTFADRSLDLWRTSGNTGVPATLAKHQLTDAAAHIGLRSQRNALPVFDTNYITVGSILGSTFKVALAELVRTEVQKVITAYKAHTHTIPSVGTTGVPNEASLLLDCASVASTVLQTRE